MSISIGECKDCERKDIVIFKNNKCIICTRLDNLEKIVIKLEREK